MGKKEIGVNRDDVIRMAREAGKTQSGVEYTMPFEVLERFAALVAAAEREECIKLCKWLADRYQESDASSCIDIISLRGKE